MADSTPFDELFAKLDYAHATCSGGDGYNYASGEEYGLRKALTMVENARKEYLANSPPKPNTGEE